MLFAVLWRSHKSLRLRLRLRLRQRKKETWWQTDIIEGRGQMGEQIRCHMDVIGIRCKWWKKLGDTWSMDVVGVRGKQKINWGDSWTSQSLWQRVRGKQKQMKRHRDIIGGKWWEDEKSFEALNSAPIITKLMPHILASISSLAASDPPSAVQVLSFIQEILPSVASLQNLYLLNQVSDSLPYFC